MPGRLPTRRSRGPASTGKWGAANRAHRENTALVSESSGIFSNNLGHGHFQHDIEHGEQSQQEQIRLAVAREGASSSPKRARTSAQSTRSLVLSCASAHGGDQPHPTPHLAVAEKGESMAH
jgi:hypothetical protein